jgi:hypothetical protein
VTCCKIETGMFSHALFKNVKKQTNYETYISTSSPPPQNRSWFSQAYADS